MKTKNITHTQHLTPAQYRALECLGNILIPGLEQSLPSFSESNCAARFDQLFEQMPKQDQADLKLLLTLLSFLPTFLLTFSAKLLLHILEKSTQISIHVPLVEQLGSLLRFMRIGLRGLIFSLYYADPEIQKRLGFEVSVYTSDLY